MADNIKLGRHRQCMATGIVMMVMFRRALFIMRGITRQIVLVAMAGVAGFMHRSEHLAGVLSKDACLETREESNQQHPLNKRLHRAPDGYTRG